MIWSMRMDTLKELIQLQSFPVRTTLNILLKDKTMKKNIIWATSSYKEFGEQYADGRYLALLFVDVFDLYNPGDIKRIT